MPVRMSMSLKTHHTFESFLPTVFGIKKITNGKKKALVYMHKHHTSHSLSIVLIAVYRYMDQDIRKEIEALTAEIASEHYEITKDVDSNLNYLWYMYHKGSKAGTFRPFVFMAELQLLKRMGYTNDKEMQGMIKMLESEDEDNIHLVTLAIKNFRDLRIQEHGEYSKVNKDYADIAKNYAFEILNHEVFMTTMAVK
jgi:hypothetical protein